mmetsp:Transcript_21989/g.38951  ORF Transcript_21989/g.38951 Transcript_21989/m.38951 type:complete len:694 (-) Transcript_21989:7-2088(-)
MQRLSKLRGHLEAQGGADTEAQGVAPEKTRSVGEWAGDLWSMATKNVALTETHGGDLVASVLEAHKVEFLFCLSGGHISPFLVSSKRKGIKIIDVRHEVNAVFAADAVGRLTGKPGVCAVTAGPGVTNTVTAIKNAAMAQSPLVLLGGAAATLMQGRGSLQDIDQLAFLSPIVKWAYSCRTVRDIVPTLRRAFQVAASGVPGPVFIELPLDVLYPYTEMLPQMGTHTRLRARDLTGPNADPKLLERVAVPREAVSKGLSPEQFVASKPPDAPVFVQVPESQKPPLVVRAAFSTVFARTFAGAFDEDYDYSPLPVTYPLPSDSDVKATAKLLHSSKRPVFLLGSQSMLHGDAGAARLVEALTSLGVPCFLGGMSRGLLGRKHPLHIRQNRGAALRKADLIVMLGMVADFRLDYGRSLPSNVPIVSVNRSQDMLKLNSGLFWKAKISALADPCDFAVALARVAAGGAGRFVSWVEVLRASNDVKEQANASSSKAAAYGRNDKQGVSLINPLDLCYQLDECLEDNSILVADGGDFVATASYVLRPRGPLSWLDPGAFGTLGVGGGFALGAALVRPDKQVYIIWGDGSAGYSLLEFDTFTRNNIPVIGVIGNDACWTQIEREQVPMFADDAACVLDYLDYEKSAEGLGGIGIKLEDPSDDLAAKFRQAQRLAQTEKRPVLVNALIGKTDFREGSLSV